MRCSKYGTENPAGKKFCGGCGSALSAKCPQCGSENNPSFRFCGDCGTPLSTQGPPAAEASGSVPSSIQVAAEPREAPDDERKTVTALFADIKGSTELIEHLDPEDARALVDPVLRLMIEAAHRYGGYIAQSTGDGIFALFGATRLRGPSSASVARGAGDAAGDSRACF
jgi:class 3 adenylate cyclase